MLNRRSLRVKVMQTLFAASQKGPSGKEGVRRLFNEQINNGRKAYLYHFVFLQEVATLFTKQAEIIAGKYLPTEQDKRFSTRFQENSFVAALESNDAFQKLVEKDKLHLMIDRDILKLCYNQFRASEAYEAFLKSSEADPQQEIDVIRKGFEEVWWPSDDFNQHVESLFPSWEEDLDWIINRVQQCFQQGKVLLKMDIADESWDFCYQLISDTLENDETFEELIAPKLMNWELERVSVMDRLLIKMALAEFIYFDTIPVKVTINEYIDISKSYSSPKSKEFINGVLDNLLKELRETGRIQKKGRGLVE